eukprot:6185002-Pleurochrysis_carterae.AAC.5
MSPDRGRRRPLRQLIPRVMPESALRAVPFGWKTARGIARSSTSSMSKRERKSRPSRPAAATGTSITTGCNAPHSNPSDRRTFPRSTCERPCCRVSAVAVADVAVTPVAEAPSARAASVLMSECDAAESRTKSRGDASAAATSVSSRTAQKHLLSSTTTPAPIAPRDAPSLPRNAHYRLV